MSHASLVRSLCASTAALALASSLAAQDLKPLTRSATNVDPVPTDRVLSIEQLDSELFAPLDMAVIQAEDAQRESTGQPPRYAIPHQVSIDPSKRGVWEAADSRTAVWRLRVQAVGAHSLNFGFGRFHAPAASRLLIYDAHDPSRTIRPFYASDNDAHGELWTPPITTDDAIIELLVDVDQIDELELELTHIGQGYRYFAPGPVRRLSGSCNVDVVCPEGDAWRSEIGAVAAYSTGGSIFCTGFMVNNTAEDGTPLFMTADHCGISSANAPSLVVFWNFENSTCRPVGASGGLGDGPLTNFNTGATWLAGYAPSDFTLVQLDDDPDPSFGVTYAGWDRGTGDHPAAIAIHHPDGEEKRISFEDQATATSSYLGTSVPGDGTHVWVEDWDLGTTEPGSSGSPLFSPDQRVIGQLHGGFAACGNDDADWYGRFDVSWTGGGTPSTRLSDWLDPIGSGDMTVDTLGGIDFRVSPGASLAASGLAGGPFSPNSITYTIQNSGDTPLDYSVTNGEAWVEVSNASGTVAADDSVDVTVSLTSVAESLGNGSYSDTIVITNETDGMGSTQRTVSLDIGRLIVGSGDTPIAIPDGDNTSSSPGTISSIISPVITGSVTDVDVGIELSHTYVGDICATLSHGGTTVDLLLRVGDGVLTCHYGSPFGCSSSNMSVVLDDEATGDVESACAPNGRLQPSNPLSVFDGMAAEGDWELVITDNAGADTGSLTSWSLELVVEDDSRVELVLPPTPLAPGMGRRK